MTTKPYLLEVGCDELPAGFLAGIQTELPQKLEQALNDARLSYNTISVCLSPRRMAIFIDALSTQQPEQTLVIKGPPISVGLDASGNPTPAAQGFAKKMGVDVTQLEQKTLEDGNTYLCLTQQDSGQPVAAILPNVLEQTILGLSGSHFMRWQPGSKTAFSRPVRWVVSLLEDTVLPLSLAGVQAGNTSRGHRFLDNDQNITIKSATDYLQQLKTQAHVVVDHQERKTLIDQQLSQLAKTQNLEIPNQPELLDHVTFLVEYPEAILGQFEAQYLKLPPQVITTVMSAHQKYFYANQQAKTLAPVFITIGNNVTPQNQSVIIDGNQKVLKARLEDASFFFDEDQKHKLGDYVESLKGISFQKNLGSLYDKTQRLVALTSPVSQQLNLSPQDTQLAMRAAELSKADLATQLVRELTELQGNIGKVYAINSGESEIVASAIDDHYLPRSAGDKVPEHPVSITLSITDKIDTLVAAFAQQGMKPPTGSRDPMGLRRLCLGLITLIDTHQLSVNLTELFGLAYEQLGPLATAKKEDALQQLETFLLQRLKGYWLDAGYRYDLQDAVLNGDSSVLSNLPKAQAQLAFLKQLVSDSKQAQLLNQLITPANRIGRILSAQYNIAAQYTQVKSTLLENDAEKALYELLGQHLENIVKAEQAPEALAKALAPLASAVEAFFDKTLVNAEDPSVKANRYALLSVLNRYYRQLGDLSKLALTENASVAP